MMRKITGFTLVEVMVALMIVALSLPALLFALDQQIDGTAYLRERSVARMVASNRLSELRLILASGSRSLRGRLTGSEEMAGQTWFWTVQTQATEVPNFSRIEVRIQSREGDAPALFTLVAFLAAGDSAASTSAVGLSNSAAALVDFRRVAGDAHAKVLAHSNTGGNAHG